MPSRYAVMGHPVTHSLSPEIHQLFAEQCGREIIYEKIQIEPTQFKTQVTDFFKEGGCGLNITLPCKEQAFALSDKVGPHGQLARSVNTLWMESGLLCSENTDGLGFARDIQRYTKLAGQRVLVLGAGGAARGILGPLLSMRPLQVTIANRTAEKARVLQQTFPDVAYCSLSDLAGPLYDVIINATSASLDERCPFMPEALMVKHPFCYDLAYKKSGDTAFVRWAKSLGGHATGGLGMLVEQAAESFYIWHKIRPETGRVLDTGFS